MTSFLANQIQTCNTPRDSKRGQSASTFPPTAPTEPQQWALILVSALDRDTRRFSSFFRSYKLLVNMPRGQLKLKATDTRGQPSVHRRVTESRTPPPAPLSTHAEVEDVEDDVAQASDEAARVTHEAAQARGTRQWDAGRPANWPKATLRRRIEERGIKLPTGMEKVKLLRMYLDNFGGDNEMDELVTVAFS